jgi:ATP-dependent helicase HrpA
MPASSERPPRRRGRRLPRASADPAAVEARRARRAASVPTVTYPPELPVTGRLDDLRAALAENQVVIVAGETGSGKTTQLPKLCLELGRGINGTIAHTQPRRIAARTVAQRIADELDVPLGGAIGYAVRFENKATDDTLVRLMTDGLLLAEIERDRLLSRYDTVIVDEAHERSLNIDFLLGYLVRLLPQRPDLKVIITSATIDSERFSEHFGDAPVIEVSGRTYPVEVRYRPLSEDDLPDPEADEDEDPADARQGHTITDRDQAEAITDAVDELLREAPGDILVFLSGEREIRDTADALTGYVPDDVEILPLYARLTTQEQQRVFRRGQSKARRRIVLATNVAETSLTVPGIKYVIDAGTARISRYSTRLKVQRLPIEPISQASAKQRAGRSGRTSDGICIRLYSEKDFDARPEFTDPEILRTSLAAVILQMALLGLGSIADYPFLDPPDARQIRDGVLLLQELGAIDPATAQGTTGPRLTPAGRRLAQLPVDPRLARMVLEADRLSCAEEVIVIVAALSIQDPRVRPTDERAQADQLHARFKDPQSDFLAFLNLWRYLETQQEELSRSRFRRKCKDEYLHHLRIREWQDLVARLRQSAKTTKVTLNQTPGEPHHIHMALLSGLLSHIGLKDVKKRDYQGARGSRFNIFPGSTIARNGPDWVMAAELVETSRLWGRTAAKIEPKWIEPLAGPLLKRTYSEPRWDRRKAGVVATERATLYGLPVITGRTVAYGSIDPVLSRDLFIQRALVEGDWDTRHDFDEDNRRLVAQVESLEDRARRRGLLAPDQVRHAFIDSRVPQDVVSGAHFDRWWRDARRADPQLLLYTRELLLDPAARAELDPQAYPTGWRQGELVLRLTYRFEPGAADDGVTVHVPLTEIANVKPDEFEWLVPGLRHELVTTLIRALPKDLRRPLVPVPDTATAVLAAVRPRRERLHDAVARELERLKGVRVPAGAWKTVELPPHLQVTFVVQGEDDAILAAGGDLDALRAQLRPRLQQQLAAAAPELQATGLTGWSIDTLPREVKLPGTGGTVTAYPSLVDEGTTVGVRVLDSRDAQAFAMRAGTRRLLLLNAPSPARWVKDRQDLRAQVALGDAALGGMDAVLEDAVAASVDHLVAQAGGPAWDSEGFARLRGHVAGELADTTAAAVARVVDLLELRSQIITAIAPLVAEAQQPVRADLQAHLARLVHRGFITGAGVGRLSDIKRYLTGILRRLERLRSNPGADAQHLATVLQLEAEAAQARAAWPAARALPPALTELPWMLEELRVSLFAQGLGTRVSVSPKKIRRLIDDSRLT